jgi:hypothetical protein
MRMRASFCKTFGISIKRAWRFLRGDSPGSGRCGDSLRVRLAFVLHGSRVAWFSISGCRITWGAEHPRAWRMDMIWGWTGCWLRFPKTPFYETYSASSNSLSSGASVGLENSMR